MNKKSCCFLIVMTVFIIFTTSSLPDNAKDNEAQAIIKKTYQIRSYFNNKDRLRWDINQEKKADSTVLALNMDGIKKELNLDWELKLVDGQVIITFTEKGKVIASLLSHMSLKMVNSDDMIYLLPIRVGSMLRSVPGYLDPETKPKSLLIQVW